MITSRAVFRVPAGRTDDFLTLAFALEDAAGGEPGTLRYSWFTGSVPGEYVVLEDYADAAAAVRHNTACAGLLLRLAEVTEMVAVDLHGDLDEALLGWVAAEPQARAFVPLGRRAG